MISLVHNALVLFVGEHPPVCSPTLERLKEVGCDIDYATRCSEVVKVLNEQKTPAIVLSKIILPEGHARKLAPSVGAVHGSLFLSFRVENGCWWIPVVLAGRTCSKDNALRPREFAKLLVTTASRMVAAVRASGRSLEDFDDEWSRTIARGASKRLLPV